MAESDNYQALFPTKTSSDQTLETPEATDYNYWIEFPTEVLPSPDAINVDHNAWVSFSADDFVAAPYITTNYRKEPVWLFNFTPQVMLAPTDESTPGLVVNIPGDYHNEFFSAIPTVLAIPPDNVRYSSVPYSPPQSSISPPYNPPSPLPKNPNPNPTPYVGPPTPAMVADPSYPDPTQRRYPMPTFSNHWPAEEVSYSPFGGSNPTSTNTTFTSSDGPQAIVHHVYFHPANQ